MRPLLIALCGFFICATVSADMIEIKGRGVLNGKIISRDESGVQFKDTNGNLYKAPLADVLYIEAQEDAPVPASKPIGFGWEARGSKWAGKARAAWRDFRYWFEKNTGREGDSGSALRGVPRSTKEMEPSTHEAKDWNIKKKRESSPRFARPADSAPTLDNSGRRITNPKYKINEDAGFSLKED